MTRLLLSFGKPRFRFRCSGSLFAAVNFSYMASSKQTARIVDEVSMSHKVMLNIFPILVSLRELFGRTAHRRTSVILFEYANVSYPLLTFNCSIEHIAIFFSLSPKQTHAQ